MALYALDTESNLVFAADAEPFRTYRCPECQSPVQKRTGLNKRPHFCHLRNAPQCRLHSKSIDHLVLQTRLKEQIPELEMERPFPAILRIADLCWERKRIVFEIQCSLILPPEAKQRQKDYAKERYALVWLLDDRLYNKKKLRLSEDILRKEAGYFISLRKGLVYDQFDPTLDGERLLKGPHLPVDLSKPLPTPQEPLPLAQLRERKTRFRGDLLDRSLRSGVYLERLLECENSLHPEPNPWWHWLKKGVQIGLEYLLRKTAEWDGS